MDATLGAGSKISAVCSGSYGGSCSGPCSPTFTHTRQVLDASSPIADYVIVDPENPLNEKSYSRLRYRGSRQPFEWTGFQARAGPGGVHLQAPPPSTTHTLQYTRTHTGTHTHTNAHIHTHTHTHMHTHTHTHMRTHAHKHTHTHECTFVYVKKKKQSL